MQFLQPTTGTIHFVDWHQRWLQCGECPLHETRGNACLWRGYLPAEVVFVGEAPGNAEDLAGFPFVGPAGHLLDEIIERAQALRPPLPRFTYAITNIICCLPKDGAETRPPSLEEKAACRPRLLEFLSFVSPRMIIAVGNEAYDEISKLSLDGTISAPFSWILHPASILRLPIHKQPPLALKQASRIINFLEKQAREEKGSGKC